MKKIISSPNAPAVVGPYSQAIQYGDLVFISGQIALNPKTGNLVEGGIEAQTKQVLQNLAAVLMECGMSAQNVLKCSCFLQDMEDFARFNEVYNTYFAESLPARETVEVGRLPKNALVEISAICGK